MRTIALALLAMSLAACNAGPPTEIASSEVESKLYFSRALQHKRVAIEGYIDFDNGPDGKAIAMAPQLRSQPYGAGEKLLPIMADFGKGPNQIASQTMSAGPMMKEHPDFGPKIVTFDPSTLTYQDAQGAAHPIHHKVRVVGEVRYAVAVKDDPRSPIGQRFTPFLTHVTFEAPPGS